MKHKDTNMVRKTSPKVHVKKWKQRNEARRTNPQTRKQKKKAEHKEGRKKGKKRRKKQRERQRERERDIDRQAKEKEREALSIMLITKKKTQRKLNKEKTPKTEQTNKKKGWIRARWVAPPPKKKDNQPKLPPPKSTALRNFTEARQNGCNWKCCCFMGNHSILWPCPRKFRKKKNTVCKKPKNQLRKCTVCLFEIYGLPFRAWERCIQKCTPAQPKIPFFLCLFSYHNSWNRQKWSNPCLSGRDPQQPSWPHLFLKSINVAKEQPKETIFWTLHTPHQSWPPSSQTPIFIVRNRRGQPTDNQVDNQLTCKQGFRWTASWLPRTCVYIYIYIYKHNRKHFWHVFSGPFLTIKVGKFWKYRRQIHTYIYIYTYIHTYIHTDIYHPGKHFDRPKKNVLWS